MSKTKRKPKKRIKRKQRRPRLGFYLLAAIVVIGLMWVLIREPEPSSGDLQELVNDQARKPSSQTQPERPQPKDQSPRVASGAETKPEPDKPREGETKLDMYIRQTADKLGVPQKNIRRRKSEGRIRFSIPLDRSQMDLTFANMIFKGELERHGASFLQGADLKNKQTLSFRMDGVPDIYDVDLYYDGSVYRNKVVNKTISIVVDDFGEIGGSLLDGFFDLDKEVCFAIFPDEKHSVVTMQRATGQGRETLIHVPMEPIGYPRINPGENAILVQHSEAQISRMLNDFIKILPDAMGINNHMGSLATTDTGVMQAVMNTLREHDMAFLDSRTTNVSVAYQVAQKSHIKAFRNDIFLDSPNISQSTMETKLNRIMQLSRSQNHVIAITHCHNADKLEYLKSFISRLKKAGFTLIPLSAVGEYRVPEIL